MAAEVHDLAADLLAALGSSITEEAPQPAQAVPPAESVAPVPAPVTTTAPTEPITTTTSTTAAVPAIEPPPEPVRATSPKRQRTPDFAETSDAKRQKTQHDPSSLDMAMLLQSALGSFDEQLNPVEALEGPDHEETPILRSATATPAPPKIEPKLMKATDNPVFMMRSMSLPVLGNLAIQILLRLAQQTRADTQALLADQDTEFRKTYETLKSIFGPARKVFSESTLLLSCDELDISDSEDRETIRISNLATVGLSIFDTQDVTLHELHDQFLSICIPELSEYKESLTDFYLSLKTQAFLGAKEALGEGQSVTGLLDQYFPADLEESLKLRNGEIFLNFGEDLLVAAVMERREILAKATNGEGSDPSQLLPPEHGDESIPLLEQYPAEKLLDDFSLFLQAHLGIIVEYAEKYGVNIPVAEERAPNGSYTEAPVEEPMENDDLAALLQSATAKMADEVEVEAEVEEPKHEELSISNGLGLSNIIQESLNNEMDLASLIRENLGEAAEAKLQSGYAMPSYASINGEVNGQPQFQSLAQLNQLHASPYHSYTQTAQQVTHTASEGGDLLPPNQSSPTSVLYERARQAAVAKSSSSTRREGLHSTRRPWTPEEEKALMAGLDMVKGPHWSQILSLFGVNGTVSDILKDRTQVQLKDKARNLKLFFLKTSSEMPYYLQSVTGELKTRAPSQAARKEAEEKARVNSEEEQARLQGIMTLASGLQNNHSNTRSPIPASTPVHGSPMAPRVGVAGLTGTPTPQGPANIAPAPGPGLAQSPDIKSEPADHSSLPHGSPQNGLPIAQQLAQMQSRVKQEVHGLPQIQPRVATPHAPLAPAPQPQAQTQGQAQPQGHSLPQPHNIHRPTTQTTATYPSYRPPQPPTQTQQSHSLGQISQTPQMQTAAQTIPQGQAQTQAHQSPQEQQPSPASQPSRVQTPAQALAQVHQPPQSQLQVESQPHAAQPPQTNGLQQAVPAPQAQPHTAAPTTNLTPSSGEQMTLHPESSHHQSADDNAEASLLETLRAAMASVPENHTPLVSSGTPTV